MAVLFAVLVGTLITNLVMKPLFARPRPYVYYADNPLFMSWYEFAGAHIESDKSFPSGHTTAAFEIGVALFLVLNTAGFSLFSQHLLVFQESTLWFTM